MSKNKIIETKQAPVGLKLKQARENLSWDIDKVKNLLKINVEKIKIIESDNYPNKIVDVYYRGYIRTLCKHFKLDHKEIFSDLSNQGFIMDNIMAKSPSISYNDARSFQINPKLILFLVIGVVVISVLLNIIKSKPPTELSDPKINLLSTFEKSKKLSLSDISSPIEIK
jgi:cytoskeletal protein RodZ